MKIKHLGILFMLLAASVWAKADEGMWLPSLLNKVNAQKMKELGAQITPEDIYNVNNSSLKDAIITLDRGSCTGEMVSAEGLFLTNHHCGYGEIQSHSSKENNYLRDGFWAMTREQELPNPGKTVTFLVRVEDVTDQVMASLNDQMPEQVRRDSILVVSGRIERSAKGDTHYETRVRSLFESNQYLLFVTETFTDVRLVGAPPSFIGKFGADTDNWMWPRHTGDFTMFRVYAGPDGKPAEYSKDNVPYKPRHFLPISLKGYENGDFAMVMGYPGSTNRYLTSEGVNYTMNLVNNTRIIVREKKLEILRDYMATSDVATIQYASKYARSSNYYKYSIGQNRGLTRLNVVNKKLETEKAFEAWVNQSEERKAKYGEALPLINQAYSRVDDDKALRYLTEALLSGPELFLFANRFSNYVDLLKTGDADRIAAEAQRLQPLMDDFYKDFHTLTDQKVAAALTHIYVEQVPAKYQPSYIATINGKYKGNYSAWAAAVFQKSIFRSPETLKAFLAKPKYTAIQKDPIFNISSELFSLLRTIRDEGTQDNMQLSRGYRLYLAGLKEMNPNANYYPDANSTMRVTYGSVGDYSPADAVQYRHYTTLKGYIEKEIPGDREFDVWPRLKELYYANEFGPYAAKDGQLYTCFTSNNDITGGNSGSPVMNGNGELIGIAFDGNWEAMSGDIAFEPELQKCINVDIRFVLWTVDVFAGAKHLVDEMTIVK